MPRWAIFADIHANLEALAAVVADARDAGCTAFACLGDVVGYGADPGPCLDLVRSLPCGPAVLGNHDAVAAGLEEPTYFNDDAAAAALWTRRMLSPEQREWLAALPLTAWLPLPGGPGGDAVLAHASPADPDTWPYVWGATEAAWAAAAADAPLVLVGHTHQAEAFVVEPEGVARRIPADVVELVAGRVVVFNAGSVGQPRDGDPRAAYGVLDAAAGTIGVRRVAYDVAAAQDKIMAAGLPEALAERLAGGW